MAKVWVIQHTLLDLLTLMHANGHGLHTMQFPTREAAEARLVGGVLAGQQTANWAPVEVDLPRGPCVPWCVLPDPDHVSVK